MQTSEFDAVADPMQEMASRPLWKIIEAAGRLAHRGRLMEAEATRHAAGYHNLRDAQGNPQL